MWTFECSQTTHNLDRTSLKSSKYQIKNIDRPNGLTVYGYTLHSPNIL